MQQETFLAALAGLVHDIGKFAVRAGERGSRTWDDQAKRDYGYYHALLTADFADRHVPEPWRAEVKNAAGNHHRPTSRRDWIVALADHLSAGERADATDDGQGAPWPDRQDRLAVRPGDRQPRQLLSIFCSLTADDGKQAPGNVYWPLAPLCLDQKALFPGPAWDDDQIWRGYGEMWRGFLSEARTLHVAHAPIGESLPTYLESFLLLMQRYTWCMPAAYYRNRPDVSLYDHSRMTAALAAVLAGGELSDARLESLAGASQDAVDPVALLVSGDISGVQDFIYTITARGATSALRGRSFYLQLLTEAVARYVLRELDLPITNLIYASGGNFYLLTRPGDQGRLTGIQRNVSRVLLAHHRGDLYVALASIPLLARDFFQGRISRAWAELHREQQRQNHRMPVRTLKHCTSHLFYTD